MHDMHEMKLAVFSFRVKASLNAFFAVIQKNAANKQKCKELIIARHAYT